MPDTPNTTAPTVTAATTSSHWGCARNEERSNFKTGPATCDGEVRFMEDTETWGFPVRFWICDKHAAERVHDGDDQ